jgi:hypothetical protein
LSKLVSSSQYKLKVLYLWDNIFLQYYLSLSRISKRLTIFAGALFNLCNSSLFFVCLFVFVYVCAIKTLLRIFTSTGCHHNLCKKNIVLQNSGRHLHSWSEHSYHLCFPGALYQCLYGSLNELIMIQRKNSNSANGVLSKIKQHTNLTVFISGIFLLIYYTFVSLRLAKCI